MRCVCGKEARIYIIESDVVKGIVFENVRLFTVGKTAIELSSKDVS